MNRTGTRPSSNSCRTPPRPVQPRHRLRRVRSTRERSHSEHATACACSCQYAPYDRSLTAEVVGQEPRPHELSEAIRITIDVRPAEALPDRVAVCVAARGAVLDVRLEELLDPIGRLERPMCRVLAGLLARRASLVAKDRRVRPDRREQVVALDDARAGLAVVLEPQARKASGELFEGAVEHEPRRGLPDPF